MAMIFYSTCEAVTDINKVRCGQRTTRNISAGETEINLCDAHMLVDAA